MGAKSARIGLSVRVPAGLLLLCISVGGCGRALPLSMEDADGTGASGADGASSTGGNDIGNIYTVNKVVPLTGGNPYPLFTDLPFTGPAFAIGDATALNGQTPFYFNYTYPANNFKLADVHIVIDTSHDTSDTEAIFVDGVFSGRPPLSLVNNSSPKVLYRTYEGNTSGYSTPNKTYMDWSLTHYKHLTRNTFDLKLDDLLTPTPVKSVDLVKNGFLPVVVGDDSPVYQGFLVIKGYTISKTALTCANSPSYTFQNGFIHNDGNSIGQSAFTGTVYAPVTSWAAAAAGQSVEWFYDAQLPRVTTTNVTIQTAAIAMNVKRVTTTAPKAAIVVNGYGVSETGFDRAQASGAVEQWDAGAGTTYWGNWLAAIPADGAAHAVTLDLLQLLGAGKLRDLLAQGKLNLSIAGSLAWVQGAEATTARTYGHPVSGPEFSVSGSYYTEVCNVPDNPSSPLSDDQPIPAGVGDHTSPVVSSLQVSDITSTAATVQWLTDEGATSQLAYGIGNTNSITTNDTTLGTYHAVTLTALQPYKAYTVRARTADGNGNLTVTKTIVFQTLR